MCDCPCAQLAAGHNQALEQGFSDGELLLVGRRAYDQALEGFATEEDRRRAMAPSNAASKGYRDTVKNAIEAASPGTPVKGVWDLVNMATISEKSWQRFVAFFNLRQLHSQ
jgi:hypothetical protein